MFEKIKLFYQALQVGSEVANADNWKVHQITANKLAVLLTVLLALAHSFGVKIDVDNQTILAVAGGLFAAINWVFTLATSKKVGLPITTLARAEQATESVQQDSVTAEPAQQEQPLPRIDVSLIREAEDALAKDRGRSIPAADSNAAILADERGGS